MSDKYFKKHICESLTYENDYQIREDGLFLKLRCDYCGKIYFINQLELLSGNTKKQIKLK